jgi:hypothetical protein
LKVAIALPDTFIAFTLRFQCGWFKDVGAATHIEMICAGLN